MRKLLLSCVLILTTQAYALVMDDEGIHTDYGTISWKNLTTLEKRLQKLERMDKLAYNAIIIGAVVVGGLYIYTKFIKKPNSQNDNNCATLDDNSDIPYTDLGTDGNRITQKINS